MEELDSVQDINHAATVTFGGKEVFNIKGWLAKEVSGALLFEREKAALNYANALRGDVAVFSNVFILVFGDIL